MSSNVSDTTLDWIEAIVPAGDRIDLTFHGGEPLLAGRQWYQRNLPLLRARFGDIHKNYPQENCHTDQRGERHSVDFLL
jgi:sulfatase maturation enzyme AslB (radical SAM superfamily)